MLKSSSCIDVISENFTFINTVKLQRYIRKELLRRIDIDAGAVDHPTINRIKKINENINYYKNKSITNDTKNRYFIRGSKCAVKVDDDVCGSRLEFPETDKPIKNRESQRKQSPAPFMGTHMQADTYAAIDAYTNTDTITYNPTIVYETGDNVLDYDQSTNILKCSNDCIESSSEADDNDLFIHHKIERS